MQIDPPGNNLSQGIVQQFRQLSIPLGLRITIFLLSTVILVADLAVITLGIWKNNTAWLEMGGSILTATFIPVIVIYHLVFSETGVSSLQKKTHEFLTKTLTSTLSNSQLPLSRVEIQEVVATSTFPSPTAQYKIRAKNGEKTAEVEFSLDINVKKINLVLHLNLNACPNRSIEEISAMLSHSLAGAKAEGYQINPNLKPMAWRPNCANLVLFRTLEPDFLWDPACKLYLAQDVRLFLLSALEEAWPIFLSAHESTE